MLQTVKAPFIELMSIPSLLIDRGDIDFQMRARSSEKLTIEKICSEYKLYRFSTISTICQIQKYFIAL